MVENSPFAPSWQQPGYVTCEAAQPSTYMLINLAYEEQWKSIQNRLAQFERYQDNWDGYGALAASPKVFSIVARLLKAFRANSNSAPSTATLSPNGAIQIEWWSGKNVLQAEIGDSHQIDWVKFGPDESPKYWSEKVVLSNSVRGKNWTTSGATEGLGVVSMSEP